MTGRDGQPDARVIQAAFQMPKLATMVSRKSSITNAFVGAVIPVVFPTVEEIAEALEIFELEPQDVRCVYCGNQSTEWDHLRPLVLNRRPTGYISEIANLVPACGKCNQSKGNKDWKKWMLSDAKHSPTGRGLADVAERIARIVKYEQWRKPVRINFEEVIGSEKWEEYWAKCDAVNDELRSAQDFAAGIRDAAVEAVQGEE